MQVHECPQCGASAAPGARACAYCRAAFVVDRLGSLGGLDAPALQRYASAYTTALRKDPGDGEAAMALGLCYLQMGSHTLAEKQFRRAIELLPFVADAYYYAALSMVRGRSLRSLSLREITQMEEWLGTAREMDGTKAQYDYLLGFLKHEYYRANGLRVRPPAGPELIDEGRAKEQDVEEVDRLLDMVPLRDEGILSAVLD